MKNRETWTFFFKRGEVPKKSNNRDITLKSGVVFENLSKSRVESSDHPEEKG